MSSLHLFHKELLYFFSLFFTFILKVVLKVFNILEVTFDGFLGCGGVKSVVLGGEVDSIAFVVEFDFDLVGKHELEYQPIW